MKYGSVCSGIEAATAAWGPLGWEAVFFSEIEKFPRAVLKHHYPDVPLHGDFTTIQDGDYGPIDLLVGGTPCQSFSIAGKRAGLDDPRGNLALEFLKLARRTRPRWLLFENVPGMLSSDRGRDFGTFTRAVSECGYGWAYRILDAQYFGVPQRRRRVFLVGYLGDCRPPAAVLFERESLSGNPPPSREKGEVVAPLTKSCFTDRGPDENHARGNQIIAFTKNDDLRDVNIDRTPTLRSGSGGGTVEVAVGCVAPTVTGGPPFSRTGNERVEAEALVAFQNRSRGDDGRGYCRAPNVLEDNTGSLDTAKPWNVARGPMVRRLTPRECERLQGFPDDYTLIPWRKKRAADCPDGPRYRALGNSMAVPVIRWLGKRIEMVEEILTEKAG